MVEPRYKKYDDPQGMEESEFTKEEISSHSSFLTNKRIDNMFAVCDVAGLTARRNPCIPTIRDYFSALMGIYNMVFCLFTEEENLELSNIMDIVSRDIISFKKSSTANDVFMCSLRMDRMYRQLVLYMQKRFFFFRTSTHAAKGLDAILASINRMGKQDNYNVDESDQELENMNNG